MNDSDPSFHAPFCAHVHLRHGERVGDLVAADDGVETNPAQHDRRRVDDPRGRLEDLGVLVVDPAAPDDLDLLSLAPAPAHVDEDRLVVEERGQRVGLLLRHPAPLLLGEIEDLLLRLRGRRGGRGRALLGRALWGRGCRYGTTTAFVSSTSTTAESPTMVTPEARVSPSFTHAHLGAIAIDRQLGDTSLLLGLDQRLRPHGSQSVGPNQRHRRLDRHERARAAVGVHRNAKELSGREVVDVQRPIGEEGETVDDGHLPNRSPTPRARWRRASVGARGRETIRTRRPSRRPTPRCRCTRRCWAGTDTCLWRRRSSGRTIGAPSVRPRALRRGHPWRSGRPTACWSCRPRARRARSSGRRSRRESTVRLVRRPARRGRSSLSPCCRSTPCRPGST